MSTTFSRSKPPVSTGIVHLGMGAFFRAHGAIYIKEAMEQAGGNWGVVGVSLRSPAVRDKLATHDYLYTAVEVSQNGLQPKQIDVVSEVLVAPEDPNAVLQLMAFKDTSIVSLTITEKGYCRGSASNPLDLNHPDIQHDISNKHPRTAPGFIVRALEIRKQKGVRPFTVLSMDNLPSNGELTQKIVLELAKQIDSDLALWIAQECTFPSTMVDRIVPATTGEFVSRLLKECNIDDIAAVSHEPFRQWVIEDNFVDNLKPQFESVGVQLVSDVKPFEHMKLRMLNGTHSALAYIGSQIGYKTVREAISDSSVSDFIDELWRIEIAPSLISPPNTNLGEYAEQLKLRYLNPEIHHLLEQIAMDGSEKLPQRVFDTLFENHQAGKPFKRLLIVLAAWISYIEQRVINAESPTINDPLESTLIAAVKASNTTPELVTNMLKLTSVFGHYPTNLIKDDLVTAVQHIQTHGIAKTMKELSA